jgi:hypothetical protein
MARKKIYNTGLSKSSIFSSKGKSSGYRPINADARRLIKPIDDTTVSDKDRAHRKYSDAINKGYPKELRHLYTEGLLQPLAKFMKMKIPLEHESLTKIRSGNLPVIKFLKKCRKLRTGLVHHPKRHNLIDLFLYGSKEKGVKPFDSTIFSGGKNNTSSNKSQNFGETKQVQKKLSLEKKRKLTLVSSKTPITPDKILPKMNVNFDQLRAKMEEVGVSFNNSGEIEVEEARMLLEALGYDLRIVHRQ